MSLSNLVRKIIRNADNSLVNDAKDRDQNAMLELVATARVECFAEYDGDEIENEIREQLNIKLNEELDDNSDTQYFRGCPVTNDKNERLAFQNPKNDTIHICRIGDAPDNWGKKSSSVSSESYGWSVCGFGSAKGKSKKTALYLSEQDIDDEYVERDGEIIGKICGNCKNAY